MKYDPGSIGACFTWLSVLLHIFTAFLFIKKKKIDAFLGYIFKCFQEGSITWFISTFDTNQQIGETHWSLSILALTSKVEIEEEKISLKEFHENCLALVYMWNLVSYVKFNVPQIMHSWCGNFYFEKPLFLFIS